MDLDPAVLKAVTEGGLGLVLLFFVHRIAGSIEGLKAQMDLMVKLQLRRMGNEPEG